MKSCPLMLLFWLCITLATVWSEEPPVLYFVYDPAGFALNRVPLQGYFDPKHSVDVLLLRDLYRHGEPVPPGVFAPVLERALRTGMGGQPAGTRVLDAARAELFIVPVPCSQVFRHLAGSPADAANETERSIAVSLFTDMLARLTYLRKDKLDHLVVCDSFAPQYIIATVAKLQDVMLVGSFEQSWDGFFPVGYATYRASRALQETTAVREEQEPSIPVAARKYRLLFTGRVVNHGGDTKHASYARFVLQQQLSRNDTVVPPGVHVDVAPDTWWAKQGSSFSDLARHSLICLSLPGDSINTDRIYNAFDYNCIPAALDLEQASLLNSLPFKAVVPWKHVILWLNSTLWMQDPMASIRDVISGLNDEQAAERLAIVERYRPDVTWTRSDSRASRNVLQAARLKSSKGKAALWFSP